MLARGSGHVVIIGSLAGLAATPRSSVYNASKFALRGFGHALREELRGTGVGVSLVSPTFVSETGMWADTGLRAKHPEVTPDQVATPVSRRSTRTAPRSWSLPRTSASACAWPDSSPS